MLAYFKMNCEMEDSGALLIYEECQDSPNCFQAKDIVATFIPVSREWVL